MSAAHSRNHTEIHFRQTRAPCIFFGNADVAGHRDFEPAADAVAIDRGNHEFRRVFETSQSFVAEKRKLIAEFRRFPGQHVDIRAGAEKLFASAAQHQHMDVFIEPRLHNRLVQLLEAIQRVRIHRRIVQLDGADAVLYPIID